MLRLPRCPISHLLAVTLTVTAVLVGGVAAPGVTDRRPPGIVADFEDGRGVVERSPGLFAYGNDRASTPRLEVVRANDDTAARGNHWLKVEYSVNGHGGFSNNLASFQNWSGYRGLSFWFRGRASGQQIEYEVKDGGVNAEHAELWQGFVTDDSTQWKNVKVPFSDLVRRSDYQPTGAPSDRVLSLTQAWGFSINLPVASGSLLFDDFTLYGTAQPQITSKATFLTAAGKTVAVPLTVRTADGAATPRPVTVTFETKSVTARGQDFTPTRGTFTLPAGTPSGTTRVVNVKTSRSTSASTARTLDLEVTAVGAGGPARTPRIVINAHGLPYLNPKLPTVARVKDLLGRMTLAEKVGQMTQAEREAVSSNSDVTAYRLGSLLSGGGSTPSPNTADTWADMIDGFQGQAMSTPLQVPLIYGSDSVHGNNNLDGATIFPHNVGLGATRDPALVKKIGAITAEETRATGVTWAFSPCVCVSRDERWGRAYEAFGEDPKLVSSMATIIDGLQGDGSLARSTSVLATAKHFLGDGGTTFGSSTTGSYTIDRGVTYATQQQVDDLHLAPFKTAVDKNVGTVMPSYSSLQITDKESASVKMHARGDQINGVLKSGMGFDGFVISDWQAIDEIPGDYRSDVKTSINAGLDMVMVPYDYKKFIDDLTSLTRAGEVRITRVDDAVSRILTKKFELGLFEKPFTDRGRTAQIGSAAHRAVARTAVAKSQVLLKNTDGLLPLPKTSDIYLAGSNADDVGNQEGGWTLSWQGQSGNRAAGTSILQGIRQVAPDAQIEYSADASASTAGHDVGIVVVGETPYTEGSGDVGNGHDLTLTAADQRAVSTVCSAMKCVVVTVSGRPLILGSANDDADALVASWLPGSEGAGVADVLFGDRPFTGRLPVTWPRSEGQLPINVGDDSYDPLYPFGAGID